MTARIINADICVISANIVLENSRYYGGTEFKNIFAMSVHVLKALVSLAAVLCLVTQRSFPQTGQKLFVTRHRTAARETIKASANTRACTKEFNTQPPTQTFFRSSRHGLWRSA